MVFFDNNYKRKTDEELMLLLTKSEKPAFDEIYVRYSKSLLNFFYKMLYCDRERAEDLMQDLFLKIIEKPQLFDCSKKFSIWIYVIASNMVKNEYRSRQTHSEHTQKMAYTNETSIKNEQQIDKNTFDKQLNIELDKIDTELKTMFNLRFEEDMSIKQIADILECPEGTVKSRLFYLTKKLSAKLSIFKPE
ncbi:MAG: sigma-70 family RNA polymerase sigma factor [Paludibacteraceae bacterium]